MWISGIAAHTAIAPERVPTALIQIYFDHPEAVPLFECEQCGLPVPVRPNRRGTLDDEPEHIYLRLCPLCDSPTGWPKFRTAGDTAALRRRRPR